MYRLLPLFTSYKATFLAAFLLVPLSGSADLIDKNSSISVEKDAATGNWMTECNASLKGLDSTEIYNGDIGLRKGDGTYIRVQFIVTASDRIYNESVPGVYDFQAKFAGHTLKVSAILYDSNLANGVGIQCVLNLGTGTLIGSGDIYNHELRWKLYGGET